MNAWTDFIVGAAYLVIEIVALTAFAAFLFVVVGIATGVLR